MTDKNSILIQRELELLKLKYNKDSEPLAIRKCNKCKQSLPITEFHRNQRSLDGYSYTCKHCDKKRKKEKLLERLERRGY